jgi:hypothetical protein
MKYCRIRIIPTIFEFLLVENCPSTHERFELDNLLVLSSSNLSFCQGTIFDQKEFERNMAGMFLMQRILRHDKVIKQSYK